MRWSAIPRLGLAITCLVAAGLNAANAACTLPHQLTNSQTADATQFMANFNALLGCLSSAGPGGSTNALQYNAGAGNFGGVGPLTNGQLVIGSTGGAPQAQSLTAGSNIGITNGSGQVTISTTGVPDGLYRQVLSATPSVAGTGLTQWLNQGSSAVSDSSVGITITAPSSGSTINVTGPYVAAPTAPYTIKALIGTTRNSSTFSMAGIGWYDGSSKLHLFAFSTSSGGANVLEVQKRPSFSGGNTADFVSQANAFSQPIWMQIGDDGTNVSFAFSQDGANFLQVFTVAKSSGYLGPTGYSNIIFFVNPLGGQTLGTLMSWTQN